MADDPNRDVPNLLHDSDAAVAKRFASAPDLGPRRWKTLWVDPEWLLILLGGWQHCRILSLPHLPELEEPLTVVDVCGVWERRAIGIRVSHPSFPDVPPGAMIPDLLGPVQWREYRLQADGQVVPWSTTDEPIAVVAGGKDNREESPC